MTQILDAERKTLILTGASRGIGHATVKRFSTAGWRVISCSRHPFPEDCPWDAGPEDHQLISPIPLTPTPPSAHEGKTTEQASTPMPCQMPPSPEEPGGRSTQSKPMKRLEESVQVTFLRLILAAGSLRSRSGQGSVVMFTSIAFLVCIFAGAAYSTSKAALASLREMDLTWSLCVRGIHRFPLKMKSSCHRHGKKSFHKFPSALTAE